MSDNDIAIDPIFDLGYGYGVNSNPNLYPNAVPAADDWNGWFTDKVDADTGFLTNPTVLGDMTIANPPTMDTHAVNKAYVDGLVDNGGIGIPEAPTDGIYYSRVNNSWAPSPTTLTVVGNTVTGDLSVVGALSVAGSTVLSTLTVTGNELVQGSLTVNGFLTVASSASFIGGISGTPIGGTSPSTGAFTNVTVGSGVNNILTVTPGATTTAAAVISTGVNGPLALSTPNAATGNAGGIILQTGTGTTGISGAISLTTGSSAFLTGGISLVAGNNTGTVLGGQISLVAGNATGTGVAGGQISLTTGSASAANSIGGSLRISLGGGGAGGSSGSVQITTVGSPNTLALTPGATASSPIVFVQSGTGGITLPPITVGSGTANKLTITPGATASSPIAFAQSGTGGISLPQITGDLYVMTNQTNILAAPGFSTIIGTSDSSDNFGGTGGLVLSGGKNTGGGSPGPVSLTTGSATTTGNANGANLTITLGAGFGTGKAGNLVVTNASGTPNVLTITPGAAAINPVAFTVSGSGGISLPATVILGSFATKSPGAALTAATYTVAATDTALVLAPTATMTLTLPAAASNGGRMLWLKLTTAFAVNSATANVAPIAGGAATTAILAATAGKFCLLQSDGTAWQLMNAN